jgi:GT2 family glycosyltransferase
MTPAAEPSQRGRPVELSVIIISFNTREITRACLQSLRDARLKVETEIIVVDNASTDGSPDMIAAAFPEVVLVRNDRNLMFSKANNQGMRLARGKYFFLLNSDTLIQPGNLERLLAFLEAHQPRVGCVGPRVLRPDLTIQSEGEAFDSYGYVLSRFFFLHKLPLPRPLKQWLLPRGFPDALTGVARPVGWVTGCSFMFPRKLVDQLGGLDEEFVFYCEEVEFCFRLWKNGYEVWVVPDAVITHLGGSSWSAAKTMEKNSRPDIPPYFDRLFLLHQKTSGVERRIRTNRLRIALYSALLPFLALVRAGSAAPVREKIGFHREENRAFRRLLAQSPAQPHNRV